MHLPGIFFFFFFFPFFPPQPFLGLKGGIWGALQFQASVKMSEGRTSGQDGLSIIRRPGMSFRSCSPLSTKGVSEPQPNPGEMATASQSKEKGL